MTLGEAIRKHRGDRSQADIARAMGVSRERVSQLENGFTMWPGPEVFNDLARALQVPAVELLRAGGVHIPQPEDEELSWLVDQLDQSGRTLLYQLGRALLPTHRRRQETGAA